MWGCYQTFLLPTSEIIALRDDWVLYICGDIKNVTHELNTSRICKKRACRDYVSCSAYFFYVDETLMVWVYRSLIVNFDQQLNLLMGTFTVENKNCLSRHRSQRDRWHAAALFNADKLSGLSGLPLREEFIPLPSGRRHSIGSIEPEQTDTNFLLFNQQNSFAHFNRTLLIRTIMMASNQWLVALRWCSVSIYICVCGTIKLPPELIGF